MPLTPVRSVFVLLALSTAATAAADSALSPEKIEAARFAVLPDRSSGRPDAEIVKAETLLARAHFSPGSIDGQDGDNFRKAVAAFQGRSGIAASGKLDQATWDKLLADRDPVLTRYTISGADAKGPFVARIPAKFEDQATLKHLGYRNIREALAERFHMSPGLLVALNPGRAFSAGETVEVVASDGPGITAKDVSVVVDKAGRSVEVFDTAGKLIAFYPATIGSEEKPAPSGRFEIRRIVHNPDYTYLPQYHFKGVQATQPFRIAPGPNNPVGSVWMDLSFDGYGIHGTPEPELVGKTQSHGCIRLTNWDAESLASLADKATPVTFQDGSSNPIAPKPADAPAPSTAPPPDAVPSADMPAKGATPAASGGAVSQP